MTNDYGNLFAVLIENGITEKEAMEIVNAISVADKEK